MVKKSALHFCVQGGKTPSPKGLKEIDSKPPDPGGAGLSQGLTLLITPVDVLGSSQGQNPLFALKDNQWDDEPSAGTLSVVFIREYDDSINCIGGKWC